MRSVPRSMTIAAVSSLALVLTACGGGDDGGSSSNPGGRPASELIVNGCNPENPLVPSTTTETYGGNVVDVTTTGLVDYNVEDGATEWHRRVDRDHDNDTFTVTLKDCNFHDGTAVTAAAFVDAWNYGALRSQRLPELLLLRADRRLHRRPVRPRDKRRRGPGPLRGQARGQDHDGPGGRGRQDVHDHAWATSPTYQSASATPRSPDAQGVLRRPQGLRREPDRHRPVHVVDS